MSRLSWWPVPTEDAGHALPAALRARDARAGRDCGWVEQMTPFVRELARTPGWIVDPFCGFGTTLVAAALEGQPAAGVDLSPERVALARERLAGMRADPARHPVIAGSLADPHVRASLRDGGARRFTLCLTNVPYFGCDGGSPGSAAADEQLYAAEWYEPYLQGLRAVFEGVHALLEPGGWCVAMVQNLRLQGRFVPLAWDLGRMLGERFELHEEQVLVYERPQERGDDPAARRRAHELALVCRKTAARLDVDVARLLLGELSAAGFDLVLYGSLARRLLGDANAEPNDVDLLCPADDAEASRLLQWLEARGFRIESWNAPFSPPVAIAALAYRHYVRARRIGRDGSALQVDVAWVAPQDWAALRGRSTRPDHAPVALLAP